MTQYLGLR